MLSAAGDLRAAAPGLGRASFMHVAGKAFAQWITDMYIALIYARAANGVIGKDGGMPGTCPKTWRTSKRLARQPRRHGPQDPWDSLPPRFRPLPGRANIVVSRAKRVE